MAGRESDESYVTRPRHVQSDKRDQVQVQERRICTVSGKCDARKIGLLQRALHCSATSATGQLPVRGAVRGRSLGMMLRFIASRTACLSAYDLGATWISAVLTDGYAFVICWT